jgi:hypothetical protein
MSFKIAKSKLMSIGFRLSPAVNMRAQKDPRCLQPALTNLSTGMKVGSHTHGSAAGLVGLPFTVRKAEGEKFAEICTNGEMTASLPDEAYPCYLERVDGLVEEGRQGKLPTLKPEGSTKYEYDPAHGKYAATDYFGMTVVSPPFAPASNKFDAATKALYQTMVKAQDFIYQDFIQAGLMNDRGCPKLAMLPRDSLHLTLADLIYADKYQRYMQGRPEESEFINRLGDVLPSAITAAKGQPLHFIIAGIVLKKQSIGALLVPQNKWDYEALLEFRKIVYNDPALQELGLVKNGEYLAHINLAYLPEQLNSSELKRAVQTVADLNKNLLSEDTNLVLTVDFADVRGFSNMESFEPLLLRTAIVNRSFT